MLERRHVFEHQGCGGELLLPTSNLHLPALVVFGAPHKTRPSFASKSLASSIHNHHKQKLLHERSGNNIRDRFGHHRLVIQWLSLSLASMADEILGGKQPLQKIWHLQVCTHQCAWSRVEDNVVSPDRSDGYVQTSNKVKNF